MGRYALFLGCQIPMRYPNLEVASRKVFEKTGLETLDMLGYSCCPEPVNSRLLDRTALLTISARNLAIAEKLGLDILTLCNGCYETLFEASDTLNHDPSQLKTVNDILKKSGKSYLGRTKVRHFVEALYEDIGINHIKKLVTKPQKLRVALHPGCHLYREHEGEDTDRKPEMMKELTLAIGAEIVDYGLEKLCCGYPTMLVDEEFSLRQRLLPKLKAIRESRAHLVVVACPACMMQFEMGQTMLTKFGLKYNIPCVSIIELLALSFGVPPLELHLDFHKIPPLPLALVREDT